MTDCIRLLQISDTHILATPQATLLGVNTAHYFNAVMDHARRSEMLFDLCLVTGDLAQDPYVESYQYLFNALEKYDFPSVCLPGNHDDYEMMQVVLSSSKVNCRKRIALKGWQIICVNSQLPGSAEGYISGSELSYLEDALREYPELFTLIAVHHNSLPCGSRWMDTMIIQNAQDLFDLTKQCRNAKVIINGHVHQVTDEQTESVRVLSTPSTCFQFKPQTENFSLDFISPGYRWIELSGDGSIKTDVVRIAEPLVGLQTDTDGY